MRTTSKPAVPRRWLVAWHVSFIVVLATATTIASTTGGGDTGPATLVGAVAVAAWYWLLRDRASSLALRLVHLGVTVAGTLVLAHQHPAFLAVAGFSCGPMFTLLPIGWASAAALVLAAGIAAILAQYFGDVMFVVGGVMAGVAIFVGLYIEAIVRQSLERQALIDELEATRRELAERERAAGVAAERQRVAREIHDTVTQDLVSAVRFIESARRELVDHPVNRSLELAEGAARDGLTEARRLIWATRATSDASTLPESLRRVCDRFTRETGVTAQLAIASEVGTLPVDVEVTLLRATQEALANIRKHAAAATVVVTISRIGTRIALDVLDDGVGFDPAAVAPATREGGFGLTGLRERVAELRGELSIESTPGNGTAINVLLPLEDRA